jgi:hypothetical protein
VIAGADDELFYADKYQTLFDEAGRSDIKVTVIPSTGHINLTLLPAGRAAAVAAVRRLDDNMERTGKASIALKAP